PGAAAGAGAQGVPGGAACGVGAGPGAAGRQLAGVQPRARSRHRAVHAVAAVAGRAAGGRTRALERAGAGAEDRATWAGGFLRPPPLAARAAGAGADHRALLVEPGAENAWPGPRPA